MGIYTCLFCKRHIYTDIKAHCVSLGYLWLEEALSWVCLLLAYPLNISHAVLVRSSNKWMSLQICCQ